MRRAVGLPIAVVALLACGGVAPAPAPVVAAPTSPPPPPLAAPDGELWLSPARAAALTLVHPRALGFTTVKARVAMDEARATHVVAPRSGVVRSVAVQPGQDVRSGALLLTIDADVVARPSSDVRYAQATAIAAAHNLLRTRDLHALGEITTADLEASEQERDKAFAALVAVRHAARSATKPVEVRAPADGVVAHLEVQPGRPVVGVDDVAQLPSEVAVLADPTHVTVVADDVPPGVRDGATVGFRTEDHPELVFMTKARVADTRPRLRCDVEDFQRRLPPGTTGLARIEGVAPEGLAVPRAALLAAGSVLVRHGDTPDGQVRLVVTQVGLASDFPGADVLVTGLALDAEIVADAAKLP